MFSPSFNIIYEILWPRLTPDSSIIPHDMVALRFPARSPRVNAVMTHIKGFIKKLSAFDASKWSEKIIACEVMEFSELQ